MPRTFKTATSRATSGNKKVITEFFITDAHDDNELDNRPRVVAFPVSQVFDEDIQRRRAQDYCDYLNKLAEAAEQAYEHNKLINILKA